MRVRTSDRYIDLYTAATGFNKVNIASFNLIYGCIRFAKYFQMHLRFKLLWDTLCGIIPRIIPVLVIFATLLLSFTWSGHWLFGHRVKQFRSFFETLMTLILSVK